MLKIETLEEDYGLASLFADAGIDLYDFSSKFHDCASPTKATIFISHLQDWVEKHAPHHPIRRLKIMHINDAMAAAGLNPKSIFAPELSDDDEHNADCVDDRDLWFKWLKRSNAIHSCNWRDSGTLVKDIAKAIGQGTDILVLHRIS